MGIWGIVKGSPNANLAWQFLQFAAQPELQAEFARRLFYGPSNPAAYSFLTSDISRQLPAYPDNLKQAVQSDVDWDAANIGRVQERFTQWLAS
jgi:putative spermidine/putrescine transport system substrate-binding protein